MILLMSENAAGAIGGLVSVLLILGMMLSGK